MRFINRLWNNILRFFRSRKNKNQKFSAQRRYKDLTIINMNDTDNKKTVLDVDLVDDNLNPAERKKIRTFTKKWVDVILAVSLIDIQLVFLLAFLGKTQIAETLGVAIVTEIVGVSIGYFLKSFFETFAESKNNLEYERIRRKYVVPSNPMVNNYTEVETDPADDAVG